MKIEFLKNGKQAKEVLKDNTEAGTGFERAAHTKAGDKPHAPVHTVVPLCEIKGRPRYHGYIDSMRF